MKKRIAILLAAVFLLVFGGCAKSLELPNPWTEFSSSEELYHETPAGMTIEPPPEGSTDITYSFLKEENLAQIKFVWKEDAYTYRCSLERKDISGVYDTFETDKNVEWNGVKLHVQYNEGKEALCEWSAKVDHYSLYSPTAGTEEQLKAVLNALLYR